jgi:hypothetical protein
MASLRSLIWNVLSSHPQSESLNIRGAFESNLVIFQHPLQKSIAWVLLVQNAIDESPFWICPSFSKQGHPVITGQCQRVGRAFLCLHGRGWCKPKRNLRFISSNRDPELRRSPFLKLRISVQYNSPPVFVAVERHPKRAVSVSSPAHTPVQKIPFLLCAALRRPQEPDPPTNCAGAGDSHTHQMCRSGMYRIVSIWTPEPKLYVRPVNAEPILLV